MQEDAPTELDSAQVDGLWLWKLIDDDGGAVAIGVAVSQAGAMDVANGVAKRLRRLEENRGTCVIVRLLDEGSP